jgi:hypothetical protein
MRRICGAGILAMAIGATPLTASAQMPSRELKLSFEPDGTVSLSASAVSVREVLLEWARLCGCLIANAHNLTGSLDVPVRFDHAPQGTVLASLLRKSAGYVLTPRTPGMTGPSEFETVYVLATSNAIATAAPAYTPPSPVPYPPVVPPPTAGSPSDELPPVTAIPTLPGRTPTVPGAAAAQTGTPMAPGGTGVAPSGPTGPTLLGPTSPIASPSRFVPIVPVPSTQTPAPSTPEVPRPPGAPSTPAAPPTRP